MKQSIRILILFAALLFCIQLMIQPVLAEEDHIVLDFFYSSGCGSCDVKLKLIEDEFEYNETYQDILVVVKKDIAANHTYRTEWKEKYSTVSYPFVVIKNETNETVIPKQHIEVVYIANVLDAYIAGMTPNETFDINETQICLPFIGCVNLSNLSLPVLTVVLGAVDSINPCAMFILFILLGLIVHAQSRRRMILVGGIFIFFSGLWYVLFMFILLTTFSAFEAGIVAIVVGCIAVMFGIVNIKDFFFYKKGVSLSIPDDKKPGIYRQMRNLVKTPYISTAILGTILLAVTVNLFEFLCSLQWPLFYVATLNLHALPAVENYLYILLYNIIYVIPLVVIVLVFAFTLGRIKLSVWQSQVLKLFSGIMILSFGVLFLVNYKILEDVMTPILLLVLSVVATTVIAIVWKRVQIAKEVN